MRPLIHLLHCEDVFTMILYDWVELKEIITLDNALTNREYREVYFQLLKTIPYKLSSRSKYSLQKSLGWFIKRNMYNLLGELDVNQSSWQNILSFPNINHNLFLKNIEKLKVRFQNSPSNYQRLNECSKLKELGCFCLTFPLSLPNSLKSMTYYQGSLNDEIISSLNACPNLTFFSSESTIFYPLKYPKEHYLEYSFFKNIEKIEIKGKVLNFFKIFSRIPNHCQHLFLDGMDVQSISNQHPTPTQPSSLQLFQQFFQNFHHLHTLEFHRTFFNTKDFLFCLIKYSSPFLTKLNLVGCGFDGFTSITEQDYNEIAHYPRKLKTFTLQNVLFSYGELPPQPAHMTYNQHRAQCKLSILEIILKCIHHELESINVSFLDNPPENVRHLIYFYCHNIRHIHVTL